jgi:hypothetical protein
MYTAPRLPVRFASLNRLEQWDPRRQMFRFAQTIAAGVTAALIIVGVAACDTTLPPAPTPTPTPSPATGSTTSQPPDPVLPVPWFTDRLVTVHGNVFEYTESGRRSVAGVRVFASGGPGFEPREATTDLGGVFVFHDLPNQMISIMVPPESGYFTPCPSGRRSLDVTSVIHVHVVSAATLTATGLPAAYPSGGIFVYGYVFEDTPSGRQPVVGAMVENNPFSEPLWRTPTTLADDHGKFTICSAVPLGDASFTLRVGKAGYRDTVFDAFVGWDAQYEPFEIKLVRD